MEPERQSPPTDNSEIAQLEKEIAELEATARKIGLEGLSTLGKACFPIVLMWIFALGIWLLPHSTPIGYMIPLYIIGLIGFILMLRVWGVRKKADPAQKKENMDILAQLEEKRKRLKTLKMKKE
jgi:hypothetical protein